MNNWSVKFPFDIISAKQCFIAIKFDWDIL